MSKKLFITSIILLIFGLNTVFAQKQSFVYNDSWGKNGFSLIENKANEVKINYSVNNFSLTEINVDGQIMHNVELSGVFLFNDKGMPDLPGGGSIIAVPQGSNVVLEIEDTRYEIIKDVEIAPAPEIPFDTEEFIPDYEKNDKVYTKNEFYPKNPVQLSKNFKIRGVDVVTLGITPFQYNPVTKELKVLRDIKVSVKFEGGNGHFGEDRLRNQWWDQILAQNIINYNSLPKIDYSERYKNDKSDGEADYVILTLNQSDYLQWADSIKDFRRKQGILTEVYTIDEIGGNTTTAIETWINNAYNNWSIPPAAVLIMADYSTGTSGIIAPSYSHPYDGNYISDNAYSDVDNDDLPEIVFARMTAQNATHLETMVTKFLDYERTPPTSSDFYLHPITALGWQDDRWFQICSEVIGGYWNSIGKETIRINALGDPAYNYTNGPWSTATNTATVISYFGEDGLNYLPDNPGTLGGFTGGNATMLNNAINSGAFMLQHRDHGGETGWGEPAYYNSDIDGITNTDMPYVWSINCLTGNFDLSYEVFAEKFHRYTYNGQNSGAVGIMAATQVSYSFVNDVYVWGAYDNMWTDFMPEEGADFPTTYIYPAFAGAAGKHFLYRSSWPYNPESKQITYRLFHHHGDAFLNIYSEVPQNLTVNCADVFIYGNTTFAVEAEDYADVAITYYDANNQEVVIAGKGQTIAGSVEVELSSVPEPGSFLTVTITKQNYFRYTKNVQVITPEGPYLVKDAISIDDSEWNDNGLADYEEEFYINITIENVGTEDATDVTATLTTEDAYVTNLTINENISFGNIAASGTSTSSNKFLVKLADSIPDQHRITFVLNIYDNSKALYESNVYITVNAPVLTIEFDEVQDSENIAFSSSPVLDVFENETYNYDIEVQMIGGNQNSIIDPGETVNIIVNMGNEGHALFREALCWIESTNPNVTLHTDTIFLPDIDVSSYQQAEFCLTVSDEAVVGEQINLIFHLLGGLYYEESEVILTVGQIIEDFESGDFSSYNWTFGGNEDWTVQSSDVYEGTFAAKSGDIDDNQTSVIEITGNVSVASNISFYKKVSCEDDTYSDNWDYLKFEINGVEQERWDGEVAWSYCEYSVNPGNTVFKWTYSKDVSVSDGGDCAWIDYIVFPPMSFSKVVTDRNITISATELPNWLNFTDNADGTANINGIAPIGEDLYSVNIEATDGTNTIYQIFDIEVKEFVQIAENEDFIRIYPVPASNILNVSFTKNPVNASIKIINANGQVVIEKYLNEKVSQISVENFTAGVYIIEIQNNNNISKQKLIIK